MEAVVIETKETFGSRFRSFRKSVIDPDTSRALSRHRMAQMVGVCVCTIRNWERDRALPTPTNRRELVRCFPGIFSHM